MPEAPALFSPWESFYVIVGSSGAALTGLMFVVITLIADTPRRSSSSEIDAFGTPTIVHFCVVLFVAAVISAPWHHLPSVALILGALGGAGIAYESIILRRARRATGYKPVLEDWVWHVVLPMIAYATFLLAGIVLMRDAAPALFAVAASTLLLLFIGIHNAWDTVTFLAIQMRRGRAEPEAPEPAVPPSAPAAPPPTTPPPSAIRR